MMVMENKKEKKDWLVSMIIIVCQPYLLVAIV